MTATLNPTRAGVDFTGTLATAQARIDHVRAEDQQRTAEALAELEAEAGAERGKLEQFEARRVQVIAETGESRVRVMPPAGYGDAWSGGGVA